MPGTGTLKLSLVVKMGHRVPGPHWEIAVVVGGGGADLSLEDIVSIRDGCGREARVTGPAGRCLQGVLRWALRPGPSM